ncbi:TonB-dependent receptor [Aliidiomarina shirensis]|uniref:TonB-dependent receptor n=1 Tax=Aliidiomarina shirensis TaxID=1048642 RepID=A0A432WST0_9GAMM|nr:TonB-dependent receptor [Aliidiomarina shirensis]RUO36830.1 TonB-dependent receptor [Aliidiomarina shirensis]
MTHKRRRLSYLTCCTLLALGSSVVLPTVSPAFAQENQAEQRTHELQIPAQRTSLALLELAEILGIQIVFSPDLTRGQTSEAIDGNFTIEEAITAVLRGTGLTFEEQGSATYVIRRSSQNSSNRVQGNFAEQVSSASGSNSRDSVERIQVIGSNIRGARAAGNLPVTILNEEDILDTGAATGDELMRSIPQIGDISFNNERTIGGVNDARGDVASINLRGIGTGNTLTLLNGRRLVLHPGTQTENFVPVTTVNSNTLPVAGLRRLEVLRDGAAALYGTDAIAGVINYVLKDDVDSSNINLTYGHSEGTSLDQLSINGSTGFSFNDGKSHLSLSAAYYDRSAMPASDRWYASNQDRRFADGIPEEYQGSTALDNRSLSSIWGIFNSPSQGTFHIRPESMGDCTQVLADGVCAASGSLPRDMRYDPAIADQTMSSGVERINLYAYYTQDLTSTTELFAEALYYDAESRRMREQNANLTAQRFIINADAAVNPFGEDVELRNFRAVDTGQRNIVVDDTSYRLLTGLRGFKDLWDWETAVLYSRADTRDMAYNRIDINAFYEAVNQTDISLAYNPFIGGNLNNLNSGFGARNNQSVIDAITTNVSRESMSELALWDFKVSNPAILEWYAGDIGVAAGVEYRYEGYADDRDPLLDGSRPFIDPETGDLISDSSVMGSSATPDASGSRNVVSAYAEFLVPLHHTVDLQLAMRHENFSDVGSVTKPKVAFSWVPADWVQLRASYAEGFRAPNLPQVVEQGVTRSNTRTDPVTDSRYSVSEVRGGNATLEPEDSKTFSYGLALAPIDNLLITADWWNIEQTGVIGILNSQTHLLYDSLLRSQGSRNEAVVRNDELEVIYVENQYNNLDVREIGGFDVSVSYRWDTRIGRFDWKINAAHLSKFEQTPDPISAIVLAEQAAGNPAVPVDISVVGAGDLLRMNGNPKLRGFTSLNWRKENISAGIRANYVSDFYETSVNVGGEPMGIPSWSTVDLFADYRFTEGTFDGTRLRLGVRNIGNEDPPIADESFGYFSNVHSNRGRYWYVNWSLTF